MKPYYKVIGPGAFQRFQPRPFKPKDGLKVGAYAVIATTGELPRIIQIQKLTEKYVKGLTQEGKSWLYQRSRVKPMTWVDERIKPAFKAKFNEFKRKGFTGNQQDSGG